MKTGNVAPVMAGLAALEVLLCAAAGTYVHWTLVRPIATVRDAVATIASGDLSVTTDASAMRGEFAEVTRSINQMTVNIRSMMSDVAKSITSMDTAIRELAAGNDDLSTRTIVQGNRLSETVSTMQSLRGTLRDNAVSATEAARISAAATDVARHGGRAVEGVAATMEEITASSSRIGEITGVVNAIAFQTNILALNAAVEAAHAGEQGRGFAVVAGEVRDLAQRSAEAAREIRNLVQDSLARIGDGHARVEEAASRTSEIVESAQRVAGIVGQISDATRGQTDRIEDVGVAIEELDRITQQNVALVEEASAVAATMREHSRFLVEAVGLFTVAKPPAPDAPTLQARTSALERFRAPRAFAEAASV
jgi:methyl-accepting chemotaxis protein